MNLTGGSPFWSMRKGLWSTYPPRDRDVACDMIIFLSDEL